MISIYSWLWKGTGNPDINIKNQQPRYANGIWHWKVFIAENEKWEKWNYGKNETAKIGKHQNTWKERKLQVLGNIGSGHLQTSTDNRNIRKEYHRRKRKTSRNQAEISSKE